MGETHPDKAKNSVTNDDANLSTGLPNETYRRSLPQLDPRELAKYNKDSTKGKMTKKALRENLLGMLKLQAEE